MQASLPSQKQLAGSEITEVEEFLDLFMVKKAVIELQVEKLMNRQELSVRCWMRCAGYCLTPVKMIVSH